MVATESPMPRQRAVAWVLDSVALLKMGAERLATKDTQGVVAVTALKAAVVTIDITGTAWLSPVTHHVQNVSRKRSRSKWGPRCSQMTCGVHCSSLSPYLADEP